MPLTSAQEIEFSRYDMYPFNWIVDGKLLASVYPSEQYLKYLGENEGVTLAVNLTGSPWDEGWAANTGIECIHSPVVDFTAPRPEDVRKIIERIDDNDGVTMIHCAAGIGRTGTVMGIYLVDKGMDPLEAVRTVRKKRPGSIQTRSQELMVFNWKRE